jgi:hypothetical protein
MSSLKSQNPNSNWDRLIYLDQANGASVDLIVDNVTRQYSASDLVSLVYHGPRPANCVSHVIDTLKPSTPDNVGWMSADASLPDQTEVPTGKEIKRRMIRPKTVVKWDDLFSVNDDGALYLGRVISKSRSSARGPRGRSRTLVTLKDAGDYVARLPKAEHTAKEWQAAMQALLLVARGGPMMLASIGMMRAIHRHEKQVFTDRKDHHWGKRKLARDR